VDDQATQLADMAAAGIRNYFHRELVRTAVTIETTVPQKEKQKKKLLM
jgi:hypothetical protein